MKAEIPAMLDGGGGSIVNISSVMGTVAVSGACAYIASKHGVVGLTKAAALDYAKDGIRVNAVAPGYVDTPMLANRSEAQRAEIASRHPMGRIAAAEEIAAVVAFLASSESSFVSGAYYTVDGGYTAL
jgi:NAD(P)-dependent dehydrogenase (short-subunit alcohol dehydrogenase family)